VAGQDHREAPDRTSTEITSMNAVYVSLVRASLFFLVGWVVMLLVACALAFWGDSPVSSGLSAGSRAWPQN
jgi:hypothetical protein